MIAAMGVPELMSTLCVVVMATFAVCAIGWFFYCITSIARAADALERIANALENDDEAEKGGVA